MRILDQLMNPEPSGVAGLCSFHGISVIPVPKFTNIYAKRGVSVNLPQRCEFGFPGTKAGVWFNTFKEPVAQQLRAQRKESQTKSYIASEIYFGVIAPVTGIP